MQISPEIEEFCFKHGIFNREEIILVQQKHDYLEKKKMDEIVITYEPALASRQYKGYDPKAKLLQLRKRQRERYGRQPGTSQAS